MNKKMNKVQEREQWRDYKEDYVVGTSGLFGPKKKRRW